MVVEDWRPVPGYPKYEVSNRGRIRSTRTQKLLALSLNQAGHPKVNFFHDGKTVTHHVSRVVARTWLPVPPRPDYIAVIHLNGDKTNCDLLNLLWRPQYFAVQYHRQFAMPYFKKSRVQVEETQTGEQFERIQLAVVKYGILFNHVLISAHQKTYVWPTYQYFRILS